MKNVNALWMLAAIAAPALADGSMVDAWDVSQGTTVTSSSGTNGLSSGNDLLGASQSGVEPGATIFRDDQAAGFTHFVEWRTAAPVTVDGFSIRANDDGGSGNRSVSEFRIYARNTVSGEFDLLRTLTPADNPYPRGFLVLSAIVQPVTAQDFRAEFVQFAGPGVGGPRIEEIDGPLPLLTTDGSIVPKKVKAKRNAKSPAKSKLKAAGFLDTGSLTPQFDTETTIDLGGVSVTSGAGLTPAGRARRLQQDGLTFIVTPSKTGSSRAKFKATYTGELTGIDFEDSLALRFRNASTDAPGQVELERGAFKLAGFFNRVEEPAVHVFNAKAKLKGGGNDALNLAMFRTFLDSKPSEAPDVRVEFGETYAVTLPSSAFRPAGFAFVLKQPVGGVTACQVTGELVTFAAKGIDLGAFAEGGNSVRVRVVVGADKREVTVRMGRKGAALKY